MPNVTVVASFKIRAGKEEEALEALRPVIEQTHDEAGCLNYALHRDKNDPSVLVIVERWTSQVALDNHFLQPYVAQLGTAAADLLTEPPVVRFCDPIALGDPIKGVL
jgi:quinol monooxygenase YgiN